MKKTKGDAVSCGKKRTGRLDNLSDIEKALSESKDSASAVSHHTHHVIFTIANFFTFSISRGICIGKVYYKKLLLWIQTPVTVKIVKQEKKIHAANRLTCKLLNL